MHNTRSTRLMPVQVPPQPRSRTMTRGRWFRHVAVCALLALSLAAVMRWYPWAWAPASIAAIVYMMYASLDMAERRSRSLREASISGPRPGTRAAAVARERIGARILATLAIGLMGIALIVAAVAIDSHMLGIGTAVTFGAIVFLGLPAWAAAVGDALPE